MVSTLSTISTGRIITSFGGVLPGNSIWRWIPNQYSGGTIGAEFLEQSGKDWLESETSDLNMIWSKNQQLQFAIGIEDDDVFIDERVPITLTKIINEHKRRKAAGAFKSASSLTNRWYQPDISDEELKTTIDEISTEWEQEIDEI